MKKIVPVILCGGSGTRLWPLSRKETPKQFLKLVDQYTLLQKTAKRTLDILGVTGHDVVTVTLSALADETERQMVEICPGLKDHILYEPQARNTAAAVALAISYIAEKFGEDCLVWILPADHHIGDESLLRDAVYRGVALAGAGYMVTFGIEPTRPETGYGYIRKSQKLESGGYKVQTFHEKPTHDRAVEFINSGEYLWSSGMHLFPLAAALEGYRMHAPATLNTVQQAQSAARNRRAPQAHLYSTVKEEPFETAVIEKSQNLAVIPCNPEWSDIGGWESLWEIKTKDACGNATDGIVVCLDTHNSMILAQERLVTCVGLKDIIIIETGDSILVADKKCGAALKILVQTLQKMNRAETISSASQQHMWGYSRAVMNAPALSLREVNIRPGMTYQQNYATGDSEWVVADGHARFRTNGKLRETSKNDVHSVEENAILSIENPHEHMLRLYEMQFNQTHRMPPATRPLPFTRDIESITPTKMAI